MNEESIRTEHVESVETPPRARVSDVDERPETAGEKLARKRDYLEGFLSQKPTDTDASEPGGATYGGAGSGATTPANPCAGN